MPTSGTGQRLTANSPKDGRLIRRADVERLQFLRDRQAEHWDHMRERVGLEEQAREQLRIVEALDTVLSIIREPYELGEWTLKAVELEGGGYKTVVIGDALAEGDEVRVREVSRSLSQSTPEGEG